jgi:hypothetical protein
MKPRRPVTCVSTVTPGIALQPAVDSVTSGANCSLRAGNAQDFFQLLRPGLQLLRPIKKEDLAERRPQRAGMVAYTEER